LLGLDTSKVRLDTGGRSEWSYPPENRPQSHPIQIKSIQSPK